MGNWGEITPTSEVITPFTTTIVVGAHFEWAFWLNKQKQGFWLRGEPNTYC